MNNLLIENVDVAILAARCAAETGHYYQRLDSDPRFCFELFRRAILAGSAPAWDALMAAYRPQIERWIRQMGVLDTRKIEDLTQEAALRFWRAYGAASFAHARGLADVLAYLRDCTRAAVLDDRRRPDPASQLTPLDEGIPAAPAPTERELAQEGPRLALWRCVSGHCHDEADRLLARCIFVEGCRPKEVYIENPQWFARQAEVYQRLRNLKDRLRRDPLFKTLLQECLA